MFDTAGTGFGSTGKKFDWDILQKYPPSKPYILSGGIDPADVEKLKKFKKGPAGSKLFALDLNSRFEMSAGVKDMKKLRTFIEELNKV